MITTLIEPFTYTYMLNAMWVSALVGAVCAFLSSYLMLKGWSLIGDALSHAIVPGVAGAYMLGLPFSLGAFFSGGLAAGAMLFLNQRTRLKEDTIIGLIFTAFFGLGLFMVSLSPTSVNIQTIVLGNILAITPADTLQLALIGVISLVILTAKWKDLMVTFFDESHARSIGIRTTFLKVLFFTLLSACTVAALQTVGAFLVIAMVVTPGATAYLLTDRFPRLILISVAIGSLTSFFGAYFSYFLDGATGGIIIVLQTLIFLPGLRLCPETRAACGPQAHGASAGGGPMISLDMLFGRVRIRVHAQRPADLGAGRHPDRGALLLSRAERLVADGRRHLACRLSRCGDFLHCRPALCCRRLCRRHVLRASDGLSQGKTAASSRIR